MKKRGKSRMITWGVLGVFGVGLVLAVVGLATAVKKIDEEAIARTPEAVLAAAGVENGADVNLPVAYFDQKADECANIYDAGATKALRGRQFEWMSCGYEYGEIEEGLVERELSAEYLPVATGKGKLTPNKGLKDFARWFTTVEEKSKEYTGSLRLKYRVAETAEFEYASNDFYPLNGAAFSAGDSVNKDGNNHLFTMSFAVPFTVNEDGGEEFEIAADDDTFVFVGRELALDMGGIHDATTGRIKIRKNGEVYMGVESEDLAFSGITLKPGEGAVMRIFHADRDSKSSVFRVRMSGMKLNAVQTQLASGNTGVEVAYGANDSSYVGPLGESVVFRPDNTRGYVIMATILGVVIVVLTVFIMATISLARRYSQRDRSREE